MRIVTTLFELVLAIGNTVCKHQRIGPLFADRPCKVREAGPVSNRVNHGNAKLPDSACEGSEALRADDDAIPAGEISRTRGAAFYAARVWVRRTVLGVGAVSALVVGLTASLAVAVSNSTTLLRKAAEATFASHSAYMQFDLSLSAPGQGSYQVLEVRGDQQFSKPQRGDFTVTIASNTGKSAKHLKELLYGTIFYVQVLGKWYSVTAQQALANVGDTGSLSNSGNPAQALAFLYQEGAKIKKLGRVSLDGTSMTKYRSIVNLDRPAEPGAPQGIAMTPAALKNFKKLTGRTSLTTVVWIDGAGVVRQEVVTFPLAPAALAKMGVQGAPSGVKETMTIDFSKFGTPVTVSPPTTSQPLPTGGSAGTPT